MTPTDTLAKALRHYGHNAQCLKTIEELSELSTQLCHHLGNRSNRLQVIDEIADVLIMVQQMKIVFGPDQVNEAMTRKLARLEERMKA